MCGIVVAASKQRALEMLELIKHRGPDAQRVVKSGSLYIGHALLSIVDQANPRAQQPLCVPDIATTAFNGEVFNYHRLSPGQTEVELLSSLIEAEHDLTSLLNGYYAVAHHDISRNRLVLCRDLYGVMPLYYTLRPLEVSSEKKALRGKVYRVPANSRVSIDLRTKRLSLHRYTQPFRFGVSKNLVSPWLTAVKTVATHTECGFSLAYSGGLDSSLVLAALRELDLPPAQILTCFVQEKDRSEVIRAQEYLKYLGWSHLHMILPVDRVPTASLRYWIESPPNPIRDFAFQRHLTVAKASPTKVLLCGEGADELGLGYPVNRRVETPVQRHLKRVSLLKSQSSMTLDRVNLAGMVYSKEYRVPFLDLDFSLAALGSDQQGKAEFKRLAQELKVPPSIIQASKYSGEELVGRAS